MTYLFKILLLLLLPIASYSQNQMKMWEYNTYKNAEKARKLHAKQRKFHIKRTSPARRKKYQYGTPTRIRHKGYK